MEKEKIRSLLEIIEHQVSSSILGGTEGDYEELEKFGYIQIHAEAIQHSATLTPQGTAYLEELRRQS